MGLTFCFNTVLRRILISDLSELIIALWPGQKMVDHEISFLLFCKFAALQCVQVVLRNVVCVFVQRANTVLLIQCTSKKALLYLGTAFREKLPPEQPENSSEYLRKHQNALIIQIVVLY